MSVRIFDGDGVVLGHLMLPASTKLADLAALRVLGVTRVEMIR